MLSEYNQNKENIIGEAIEACTQLKNAKAFILIAESRSYLSDDEKDEIRTKHLKSIAPEIPEGWATQIVGYVAYRSQVDGILKSKNVSRVSAKKLRPVQCIDKAFPASCEAIMEIPLLYKYFPEEKSLEFKDLAEASKECSALI